MKNLRPGATTLKAVLCVQKVFLSYREGGLKKGFYGHYCVGAENQSCTESESVPSFDGGREPP